MEATVTFKVNYYQDDEKKSGICLGEILCGDVEGDGLPIPVYMAILKAMLQVEGILNWEEPEVHVPHPGLPITSPGEYLKEMGATSKDVIKQFIEGQPSVSPPPPLAENSSNNEQDEKSLH